MGSWAPFVVLKNRTPPFCVFVFVFVFVFVCLFFVGPGFLRGVGARGTGLDLTFWDSLGQVGTRFLVWVKFQLLASLLHLRKASENPENYAATGWHSAGRFHSSLPESSPESLPEPEPESLPEPEPESLLEPEWERGAVAALE
jgi:hypothetical protein